MRQIIPLVTSAVTAYLLVQPDGVITPLAKVVIGAINVGSTTLALYLAHIISIYLLSIDIYRESMAYILIWTLVIAMSH